MKARAIEFAKDLALGVIPNGAALGIISLTDIELIAKIGVSVTAMVYTGLLIARLITNWAKGKQ